MATVRTSANLPEAQNRTPPSSKGTQFFMEKFHSRMGVGAGAYAPRGPLAPGRRVVEGCPTRHAITGYLISDKKILNSYAISDKQVLTYDSPIPAQERI